MGQAKVQGLEYKYNEAPTARRRASSEQIALLSIGEGLAPGATWMAVMAAGFNFADARGFVLKMQEEGLLTTETLPDGGFGYALTPAGKEKLFVQDEPSFEVGRIIEALKGDDTEEAQVLIDTVRSSLGGLAIPYDRPQQQHDHEQAF